MKRGLIIVVVVVVAVVSVTAAVADIIIVAAAAATAAGSTYLTSQSAISIVILFKVLQMTQIRICSTRLAIMPYLVVPLYVCRPI